MCPISVLNRNIPYIVMHINSESLNVLKLSEEFISRLKWNIKWYMFSCPKIPSSIISVVGDILTDLPKKTYYFYWWALKGRNTVSMDILYLIGGLCIKIVIKKTNNMSPMITWNKNHLVVSSINKASRQWHAQGFARGVDFWKVKNRRQTFLISILRGVRTPTF